MLRIAGLLGSSRFTLKHADSTFLWLAPSARPSCRLGKPHCLRVDLFAASATEFSMPCGHAVMRNGFRMAYLDDMDGFAEFLSPLYDIEWVVWADPPEASPEVVLKYLARYTYRVAISNSRIVSISDGKVTFRYKDYARDGQCGTITLDADEFLRRFCLHVLPKGFVRIRSFGILANCHRAEKLALSRQLLGAPAPTDCAPPVVPPPEESSRCPHCGQGTLHCIRRTRRPRVSELVAQTYQSQPFDSS